MDDWLLDALAESIQRNGQQQYGLTRQCPRGTRIGWRRYAACGRLEVCRRAGVRWKAGLREPSFTDAECASQMHDENEWSEDVSALETAVQWKAMLHAGVSSTGTELAQKPRLPPRHGRAGRAHGQGAVSANPG